MAVYLLTTLSNAHLLAVRLYSFKQVATGDADSQNNSSSVRNSELFQTIGGVQVDEAARRGAVGVILYIDDDTDEIDRPSAVNSSAITDESVGPDEAALPGWASLHGSLYRQGDPSTPGQPSTGMDYAISELTKYDNRRLVDCNSAHGRCS